MKVVSQSVVAIEHDEAVDIDWNLTLQRLEIEPDDVPGDPTRVGENFDALFLRARGAGSGGGPVPDVSTPADELGGIHPMSLGDHLYGIIGTAPHDRYSSAQVFMESAGGPRTKCHMVAKPDYEVEFFVCLSTEQPTSLHVEIAGMDYDYPVHWPS